MKKKFVKVIIYFISAFIIQAISDLIVGPHDRLEKYVYLSAGALIGAILMTLFPNED